ncbi:MAG: AIR carboxylase family protein, partial [Anaerotignum sp.]|nr:AIR carboxylase family protein [Anaerotignum sp.]
MKKIGIVMGSDSDLPVVEKAMATLEKFGVPFEAHVYSAHRTPVEASEFAKGARENGFGAIIAAAGKAAHLAGAMAANTTLPVIGIPIKSSTLDGLDALLSTVQMPSGLPSAEPQLYFRMFTDRRFTRQTLSAQERPSQHKA